MKVCYLAGIVNIKVTQCEDSVTFSQVQGLHLGTYFPWVRGWCEVGRELEADKGITNTAICFTDFN